MSGFAVKPVISMRVMARYWMSAFRSKPPAELSTQPTSAASQWANHSKHSIVNAEGANGRTLWWLITTAKPVSQGQVFLYQGLTSPPTVEAGDANVVCFRCFLANRNPQLAAKTPRMRANLWAPQAPADEVCYTSFPFYAIYPIQALNSCSWECCGVACARNDWKVNLNVFTTICSNFVSKLHGSRNHVLPFAKSWSFILAYG